MFTDEVKCRLRLPLQLESWGTQKLFLARSPDLGLRPVKLLKMIV